MRLRFSLIPLMRKAEKRAKETGKVIRDGAVPLVGEELDDLQSGSSKVKPNVFTDFIVPIIIIVAMAIITYITKGGVKILECFIVTVIYQAIVLSIRRVFTSIKDMMDTRIRV